MCGGESVCVVCGRRCVCVWERVCVCVGEGVSHVVSRHALRPSAQMSTISNGVHCGKKSLFMAFAP